MYDYKPNWTAPAINLIISTTKFRWKAGGKLRLGWKHDSFIWSILKHKKIQIYPRKQQSSATSPERGGGGGTSQTFWWGCATRFFKSWPYWISDQSMNFPVPFFRPGTTSKCELYQNNPTSIVYFPFSQLRGRTLLAPMYRLCCR